MNISILMDAVKKVSISDFQISASRSRKVSYGHSVLIVLIIALKLA